MAGKLGAQDDWIWTNQDLREEMLVKCANKTNNSDIDNVNILAIVTVPTFKLLGFHPSGTSNIRRGCV